MMGERIGWGWGGGWGGGWGWGYDDNNEDIPLMIVGCGMCDIY